MAKRELNQISVFEDLTNKRIEQKEAAQILGLSVRQVKRKIKEYRRVGSVSLIHKSRGKPSNRRLKEDEIETVLNLVRENYSDFGPTFAAEKLLEIHKIKINPETLRLKMIEVGLWKPNIKKVNRHYFRQRKASFGELVQIDGSPHRWFEDRAPGCTLIAFIDDATSRILSLEFAESETTIALMKATKNYLTGFGKPVALYSDRGCVYKVNIHNIEEEKVTQYKRALDEIDIRLIWARSPQAKGRVERLFKTLQDRLVKELRLRSISDIKTANEFLKEEYIGKHNNKFSVVAQSENNLHRPLKGYNLDQVFCLKEERSVNKDMTIRYRTGWFQLEKKQPTLIFPKNTIEVWESLDQEITFHLRKCRLNAVRLDAKPIRIKEKKEAKERKVWKLTPAHPWLNNKKRDISTLEESDILILV
jgi:transposase